MAALPELAQAVAAPQLNGPTAVARPDHAATRSLNQMIGFRVISLIQFDTE